MRNSFPTSTHGALGCTFCHGGNAAASEPEQAHAGLQPGDGTCASCHAPIVWQHATSLHSTLTGQDLALRLRAGDDLPGLPH
ncbi:MAG: hypothetical protein HY335_03595 [Deinococcus sp.]|nr:hypothetical protein [Deinococcus sp.]